VLLCFSPANCFAEESEQQIYSEMVNGFPPTISGQDKSILQDKIHQESQVLRQDFKVLYRGRLKSCDLYADILRRLSRQIDRNVQTLPVFNKLNFLTDDEVLQYTRLRLLIPGLFGLHGLFKNGSEGGYGTIDKRIHSSCPIASRQSVTDNFDQIVRDLSRFNREGLGNPGVFGFEQLTNRLYQIADRQETFRNEISWATFGAAALVSIVFWEFAPVAVASAATQISIAVPRVLQPILIFGARSVALGSEGLAYHYLDQAILPPQSEGARETLASWDEQMRELQNLTKTPLASPQVYIAYVGQVKRQLAALYQPWLKEHLPHLQKEFNQLNTIGAPP
jgi:hypothetical protein